MEASKKRGLSGSTLKLIAIVTMLIDHVGAALLGRLLIVEGYMEAILTNDQATVVAWVQEHMLLFRSYEITRYIGRIAFPIFCFLLIEGFKHTRDVKKYALRLGVFALVSEIPFDLAFSASVLEFGYQNVFFTLFIGLLVIIGVDKIDKLNMNKIGNFLVRVVIVAAGAVVAELLRTDYGAIGVICITVLYLFHSNKVAQIIAGCVVFLWELTAPLAFIPIGFYNKSRGLKLKYIFYIFYPLHLLIIYLICMYMGIHGYAVV